MPIIEKMKGIVIIEEGEPAADIRVAFFPLCGTNKEWTKVGGDMQRPDRPMGKPPRHIFTPLSRRADAVIPTFGNQG